jgi:hypothetical protein
MTDDLVEQARSWLCDPRHRKYQTTDVRLAAFAREQIARRLSEWADRIEDRDVVRDSVYELQRDVVHFLRFDAEQLREGKP